VTDRLYFRQLLAGRDFAVGDPIATQMVNFAYLIGDRDTRECLVVDPAYAVRDIVDVAVADEMRVTGALVSHYHPDHIGGSMMGWELEGLAELLELDGPARTIHVNRAEAAGVTKVTGIAGSELTLHDGGDTVEIGSIPITLVHTPGHTPGSQCFLVEHHLVSGDTLFLEGCGRTDLPGGDSDALYESLTQRLAVLPSDTIVCPGHMYSAAPSASMAEVLAHNYVFRPRDLDQWRAMFGAG